jgi:hypothetical protein
VRELHAREKKILLASSAEAAEVEYHARLLDIEKHLTATTSELRWRKYWQPAQH